VEGEEARERERRELGTSERRRTLQEEDIEASFSACS